MDNSKAMPQRISDFKGFCASRGITYKEAIEKAGYDYESVKSNFASALKGVNAISSERMDDIEQAAIDLAESKVQTETA